MGIPFSLPISRRDKKKQIHNYQRVIMSVLGSKTLQLTRKTTTTIIPRRSMHVNTEGIPGSFLPFGTENPIKCMFGFALYVGSAFSLPFLCVIYQLEKKSK